MAFDSQNFLIQSLAVKNSEPRLISYVSSDSVATVKASGYFNNAAVRVGDAINAVCNGVQAEFQIATLNPMTVVTNTQT